MPISKPYLWSGPGAVLAVAIVKTTSPAQASWPLWGLQESARLGAALVLCRGRGMSTRWKAVLEVSLGLVWRREDCSNGFLLSPT